MASKITLVIFLLDETGSMESYKEATINGFNEYLQSLKKDGKDTLFTLTRFNSDKIETPYSAVPISEVEELTDETYRPDAMTPLYDAIAKTVRKTEEALKGKRSKPKILFVIQTDGLENASREHDRRAIFQMIEAKKAEKWMFVYLGADQDAWDVGTSIGIPGSNTMNYTGAKTREAFAVAAAASVSYRASPSERADKFWDSDDDE
jgi:hypothetical protein